MSDECPNQQTVMPLTEKTVSKPNATLEVRLIQIPRLVQEAISASLQQGRDNRQDPPR